MNKGIIMEIKKDYAIALNNSGVMEKILLKKDMKVGQKIFYFEEDIIKTTNRTNMHNSFIKTFGSIAAIFLLVFTFFQGITYENAYAVVSLDINPSIQIEANSKKKIVKIQGINDDGKNIDFSSIVGRNINDGIEEIKQILIEKKYLDENKEVLVAFALIKGSDDNQYEESIKGAIQETFKTENITYVTGNKEAVAEAKTQGISLGRYEASLKATDEVKKNIKVIPVKEITSSIKDDKSVITWEANDEKVESGNESGTNENKEQTVQKPATENKPVDKPVQKPEITVPADVIDNSKNQESNESNNTKEPEDNGIIDLEPEIQTPPNQQVEEPEKKPEDNNTVNPDNGSVENNTNKNEEDGSIQIAPDSQNKINK